ncbi:MAG: glycosyltransferase family 39 protein, partial [Acidimicrobiales bacterium]
SAFLVLHDLGSRSLWVDEGATFAYASQRGIGLWHAVTADGGNMMAYYAAMHLVIGLFGSSPEVLRLPSAAATVATVPVCFALVARIFDRRAATLSALLVAASVPLVFWGQMARAYAPAVLFLSASTLAFVVALQSGRKIAWIAYCALSVVAIYTILLAALVITAQFLALAFRRREDLPLARIGLSAGAVIVLSVPLGLVALAHGTSQLDWMPATGPPFDATNRYLANFVASATQGGVPSGGQEHLVFVGMAAAWVLAAAHFAHCLARRRRSEETFAWALLGGTFLLPLLTTYAVSELVHPLLSDRYLLAVVAPASMTAGVACSRIRPAPGAWMAGLLLAGLRLAQIPPTYAVSLEAWQPATSYVLQRAQPHDCAGFFVADGFPVFDYYLLASGLPAGRLPEPVLPESRWSARTPYELDPATFSPVELRRTAASCPRLWLVETHQTGIAPAPGVPSYQVRKLHAYRALVREIHGYYVKVARKVFTGVAVVLFDRRTADAPLRS